MTALQNSNKPPQQQLTKKKKTPNWNKQ